MKIDLSAHDDDAHGAIKTADGRVVVPFVLLLESLKAGRPWRVACLSVAELLRAAWPLSWYLLTPGDYAMPLDELLRDERMRLANDEQRKADAMAERFRDFVSRGLSAGAMPATKALTVHEAALELIEHFRTDFERLEGLTQRWPDEPTSSVLVDTSGLADAMAECAAEAKSLDEFGRSLAGQVAIGLEDVRRVFPALEVVGDHGAEAIFRRMESAGLWPRRKAEKGRKVQAWTDDERAAAFELRSVLKASEAILLERIGVTRQALDLAIGGATVPLTNRWPECWRPSPELLRRGGFPVAELTLQDACKPAPKGARKAA